MSASISSSIAWIPACAAGGSALAISKNGGATFQNVLLLGGGQFERINHVAVGLAPPTAPAPAVVYALGVSTTGVFKIFVSFDGGMNWTQDQGTIPPNVGAAVGTANSQAPSVTVISPRSPLEVFLLGNGSGEDHVPTLWRGTTRSFWGPSNPSGRRSLSRIWVVRIAAMFSLRPRSSGTEICCSMVGSAARNWPAWNAGSIFGMRGSRPIVLTKPGAGDGDYVFIRFRTDEKAVVLRTKSLLDIVSPDDWDTLWQVSTPTAQMQFGGNTTKSTPPEEELR